MSRTPRRRVAVGLLGAALGASLAVPVSAQVAPLSEPTQVALVQDELGGLALVEVTDGQLAELRADPAVGPVVTRGGRASTAMAQSVPKVGAPTLWSGGQTGAGKVIVVIDTGVATSFGGTLVGQACFAANRTGSIGYCGPSANSLQAFDATCFSMGVCDAADPEHVLDPVAARPCAGGAEECEHGTAVAAVAARHDVPSGVAPDAGVYAIRVFDPTGSEAFYFDVLRALDHVRALAEAGMDIAAVNLSLSGEIFSGPCDLGPGATDDALLFRQVFDELALRGIASVVASGNDFRQGSMGFPACVSSAVAVGATDLDDDLADFGNRGPGLDLLAPGADEASAGVALDPMEIPGSPQEAWAGTSFSAPHVAGAFALLAPQYPKASSIQLAAFLRSSGVPVEDPATGAVYPRLRLRAPAQALAAGVFFSTGAAIAGTPRSAIGDLDGDGHADVLAHAPGPAPDLVAYGGGSWTPTTRSYAVTGTYSPLVGQFRGGRAGPDDILWYAPGPGADSLWPGSPTRTFAPVALSVNGTYTPVIGDFDGDGYDDLFWYGPGDVGDSIWYGGPSGFTSVASRVTGSYRVAVGDFDDDGRDDLVFHGPNSAPDALWLGSSTRGAWTKRTLSMGGSYNQVVGDVDGNGADDLVLYQPGTRSDSIWRGGPAVGGPGAQAGFAPLAITVNATYQPIVGDVDDDGRADIVWYAPGTARDFVWFGQPEGVPRSRPVVVNGVYTPLVGDLDADDGADIVWFSTAWTTAPVWWSYVP